MQLDWSESNSGGTKSECVKLMAVSVVINQLQAFISFLANPTIVFVTVNAEKRNPWIAQPQVHQLLVQTWREATAWLVGYYLLMPDHLHLFAAPYDIEIPFNRWVSYWKRLFTMKAKNPEWAWQSLHWDTRLRRPESYKEKWDYIRENPMRKGLVAKPEDWPYQGMLNVLRW